MYDNKHMYKFLDIFQFGSPLQLASSTSTGGHAFETYFLIVHIDKNFNLPRNIQSKQPKNLSLTKAESIPSVKEQLKTHNA